MDAARVAFSSVSAGRVREGDVLLVARHGSDPRGGEARSGRTPPFACSMSMVGRIVEVVANDKSTDSSYGTASASSGLPSGECEGVRGAAGLALRCGRGDTYTVDEDDVFYFVCDAQHPRRAHVIAVPSIYNNTGLSKPLVHFAVVHAALQEELRRVDFRDCSLGDTHAEALCEVLSQRAGSTFELLCLAQNRLSPRGAAAVAKLCTTCTIQLLDLNSNDFGPTLLTADMALGGLFQAKSLDVSFCSISALVASSVDLAEFEPAVEDVNLDGNFLVEFRAADEHLLRHVARLSACCTRIENMWTTVGFLRRLPALRQLSFQYAPVRDAEDTDDTNDIGSSMEALRIRDRGLVMSRYRNDLYRPSRESNFASPLCCHSMYEDAVVAFLPQLQVVDGKVVSAEQREESLSRMSDRFCLMPQMKCLTSAPQLLADREIRGGRGFRARYHENALASFRHPRCEDVETGGFCARQFEYSYHKPDELVFGTTSGRAVVVNHKQQRIRGVVRVSPHDHCVLGLSWLRSDANKFVAGVDEGTIKLVDVDRACTGRDPIVYEYERFSSLTSLHVNCQDDWIVSSGYGHSVGIYDLKIGQRLRTIPGAHGDHINVVKFANTHPNLFVSSSFDKSVKLWDLRESSNRPVFTSISDEGNVMAVFSPDDRHILVSALDNEIRQLNTSDGSLDIKYDIPQYGSEYNYSRAYYINDGSHIIVGSCDENVLRGLCSKTGRLLFEVHFETGVFVQSLRGDPHRDFSMSALIGMKFAHVPSRLVKVEVGV